MAQARHFFQKLIVRGVDARVDDRDGGPGGSSRFVFPGGKGIDLAQSPLRRNQGVVRDQIGPIEMVGFHSFDCGEAAHEIRP